MPIAVVDILLNIFAEVLWTIKAELEQLVVISIQVTIMSQVIITLQISF